MSRPEASADRVRLAARSLTGAGAALTLIGGLGVVAAVVAADWLLILLGILAIGVGAFVLLAGLGLRQTVRQSERRLHGATVDAAAAATIAAATVPATPGPAGACTDQPTCGVECTSACALAGLRRH